MSSSLKSFYLNVTVLCALLASLSCLGCATKAKHVDEISQQDKYAQYFQEQHKAVLVPTAESAIGTPYKFGGTDGNGFDCSGFVRWVYRNAGVNLPRTAREQSKLGLAIKDEDEMQVGDIVAFYNKRRGYHTGIYVGDGKFVHSPRRRTKVRISELSTPYFKNSFLSARRVVENIKSSELEAAEDLLATYYSNEKAKTVAKANAKSKAKTRAENKVKSVASASSKSKVKAKTKAKSKVKSVAKISSKSKSQAKAHNKTESINKSVAKAQTKQKESKPKSKRSVKSEQAKNKS